MIAQGYVLHQYPYGDDSIVLKLFTHEHGYISAIAKHIKGRRTGWVNWLRPFSLLSIQLCGRGQLLNITSVEPVQPAIHLIGQRLYAGLYLNELLVGFLPEAEPLPELLCQYQESIEALRQLEIEPVLRSFELALLSVLGYRPTLLWDQEQQSIEAEHFYQLLPEHLPRRTFGQANDSMVFSGAILQSIADQAWESPETLKAAKRLMRAWINHYRKGKPLKSRELFLRS